MGFGGGVAGRMNAGCSTERIDLQTGVVGENQFARNLFTITFPVDNDHEIEFMTSECILAKVFRDIGDEDLVEIMCCKRDFDTTPAYCRWVSLKRTKFLMKEDAYCDTKNCWR